MWKWLEQMLMKISGFTKLVDVSCVSNITRSQLEYYFEKWEIKQQIICDDDYCLMNPQDMEELLKLNYGRLKKYVGQYYDCDDYSFVLKGMLSFLANGFAHGIVHVRTLTGSHALNFFFDNKQKLWYIEPQTNEIFSFKIGSMRGYRPYLVII